MSAIPKSGIRPGSKIVCPPHQISTAGLCIRSLICLCALSSLRQRLRMSQAELGRRFECSAMTVSRWERGLLAPSSDYYIQLGNLAGKSECWYFWERAGLQLPDVLRALPARLRPKLPVSALPALEGAHAGTAARSKDP